MIFDIYNIYIVIFFSLFEHFGNCSYLFSTWVGGVGKWFWGWKHKNEFFFFSFESVGALRRAFVFGFEDVVYLAGLFWVFLGRRTAWMLGRTPPWAMVTPDRSLFNSSSLRMANCK